MRTDLEQQLPRFAEALDREAPAISVEEILNRGTIAVEVDRLQRPAWGQVPRINGVSWGDAMPGHRENGEREVSIELAPTAAEPPNRRRVALKVTLAAAAAIVLVVALAAIVRTREEPDPADVPTVPTPSTVPIPPRSGGMWPQSTLDEVSAAQQLADAGDPGYTWQVDQQLADGPGTLEQGGHVELVDRFLREVLGWEAYVLSDVGEGAAPDLSYSAFNGQRYLRCAPGRTNPLYPPGPEPDRGELCAPTLDDLHYESVSLDLAQLDRQDPNGVWVVNRWEQTAPFAQFDPAVVAAQGTERLERFLAARIAGQGAEWLVEFGQGVVDVPLLYATTSGAPYDRYEIERVDRPRWFEGSLTFSARLFADRDATVVEQEFFWGTGRLWMLDDATTENGQPVTMSYTSSDGEVSISAPTTWQTWSGGGTNHQYAPGVWFWEFFRGEIGDEDRIEFTDPVAYDTLCAANGGSPLLVAPADAAAIAQQIIANPNFETTAPVTAHVGDLEAVSIDVALAPGGRACGVGIEISRWIHTVESQPGSRLRLYLVDLPEGMSVQTLAITVVAPEERFEEVVAETAPIIESIEFHPQSA